MSLWVYGRNPGLCEESMTLTTFLIALGAALGLGLLIGVERQFGQHPAGLRTNALVCGAARRCTSCWRDRSIGGADAAKVAAQIVSGIGFLGGGVILREGLTVRGLTTAATLWCSAAVGALCGADLTREAVIATGAILATNCCSIRSAAGSIERPPNESTSIPRTA